MIQHDTKKVVGWNSTRAIHPGEHLVDFLEQSGISQVELAQRTGLSKKAINEIVNKKSPITQNTAFRLSKVFSVSPEFWINLQNNYDLLLAQKEEEERLHTDAGQNIEAFKETYQELAKHEFLQKFSWTKNNLLAITKGLQQFFAVDSLAYVEGNTLSFAFRKYQRENINNYTLAAWVQLGKLQSRFVATQPFDKEALKEALPRIKELSLKKWQAYIPELENLLAECGVVLVLAPHLKHAPVQGATHWLESDKVLVMLSADNQYEGRFWFNLFHELGHVLLHGKRDIYVDFGQDGTKTGEEKEADTFAQKWLISDMKGFYALLSQQNLAQAVVTFARDNNVSPAIVAGRLTHEHGAANKRIYPLMSPFQKERISYSNITLGAK